MSNTDRGYCAITLGYAFQERAKRPRAVGRGALGRYFAFLQRRRARRGWRKSQRVRAKRMSVIQAPQMRPFAPPVSQCSETS